MSDLIDSLAAELRAAERVVWLTGAGLSVASGIPPYRKSNEAVWSRFIMEWGTRRRLMAEPLAWWREFWLESHDLDPTKVHPNAGHEALTDIVTRRSGHLVVTQNVDDLHRRAGLVERQLIEIHGRHGLYRCTDGDCSHFREPLGPDAVDTDAIRAGAVPRCPACGEILRPLVLLFDERYDSHPFFRARDAFAAFEAADAIVFVGTSYSVGVTELALEAGKQSGALLVNVNVDPFQPDQGWLYRRVRVRDVLGRAEEVLPRLAAQLV
ncbi:MAG: hypothetical protein EP329_07665 [Deltaproteobacteria bacterium]|nr:MAG: hypothetical protein EP329_07665 [Deltaproteobacteria bacterium]